MYTKNLSQDFRLRLSSEDMEFLKGLSDQRSQTVSEVVRSIIQEYKRSVETIAILKDAIEVAKHKEVLSNGDKPTDLNDLV